jgi:acetyl-CoA carboxylase carboxyl transferase subunit beta
VLTGSGRIAGRAVALIVGEFGFLGGSIGQAATDRIMRAVERATAERLPLFAAPSSGGTRMQEGTPAFVGMVAITDAVLRHKQAGLPYVVYLRHPTTGGVFASWGSLGHFTAAEPGALIGFLGPRVYEELFGTPFPRDVQTAENLLAHGLVDAVIGAEDLAGAAGQVLDAVTVPSRSTASPQNVPLEQLPERPTWESVRISRRPDRPGVHDLLSNAADVAVPLSGTSEGERDAGMILALARFGRVPCVVVGQDRHHQSTVRPIGPGGLRKARRGMRLAAQLQLPLLSVVDTSGVELSQEAEEGAIAGEIARCIADLITLETPTVCLILGEGAGGGALAMLPADVVLCTEHGWLSPLPPEGASAILFRTAERAPELAEQQGVRARDLLRSGIVDRIVAEHPDAACEPEGFCARISQILQHELGQLAAVDPQGRRRRRTRRGLTAG